jgi:polyphosphate:AMP phosphotransferase
MFETAELGQKIPKQAFEEQEEVLWNDLLTAQRQLRTSGNSNVIIDFAGVHGAGKLSSINLLNKWMDPRWIVTQAYDEPTDDERQRPDFWRFWRDLPPKGQIGLYLSGRYSFPLIDYVYEKISETEFRRRLDHILAFERMLADDGALILKFWMHLGRAQQKKRMKALEKDPLQQWRVNENDWRHWKLYDKFIAAAEILIAHTSTGYAPWHIVEGQDYSYRSLQAGEIVLKAIENHLEASRLNGKLISEIENNKKPDHKIGKPGVQTETPPPMEKNQHFVTVLDTLDTSKSLDKKDYKRKMVKYTSELHLLQDKAKRNKISTVLVFEGPDAAGKGGIIRRLINGLDAVDYKIAAFGAPTNHENRYHYLRRFWKCMPLAGRMTIFDRSWYGRVLVERIESFASEAEWKRAYAEINEFESQLIEHGTVLLKFWINVTQEEQLARFTARKEIPHKRWKLNDEDWRNRNNWEKYNLAVHDMVQQTSTAIAPWILVEGNSKLYSRTKVMQKVCEKLAAAVSA